MAKLEGKGRTGDAVHQNQKMASKEGFKNVSKIWLDQTMTLKQVNAKLEADKSLVKDVVCPLNDMIPSISDGKFVMQYRGDDMQQQDFLPTDHALDLMCAWTDSVGAHTAKVLSKPIVDKEGNVLRERDEQDATVLRDLFLNSFRTIDRSKEFMFRLRLPDDKTKQPTLRAMCSKDYAPISNEWFIHVLARIIPGGRFSHWYGDPDTIYGNLLIPDTIRQEKDSDYGGMIAFGNSEVRTRRLFTRPSVFRAICMNGCIWDQEKGESIDMIHRGQIDLLELSNAIEKNINNQIPLLEKGIQRLLATRAYGCGDTPMPNVFAQVKEYFNLKRPQSISTYREYIEADDDQHKSAFGVINAITRAAQMLPAEDHLAMDEIGGKIVKMSRIEWTDRIVKPAKRLNDKMIEAALN